MKSHIDALRDKRFIPDNATEERHDDLDMVFYVYQNSANADALICYEGRRIKPSFIYRFAYKKKRDLYKQKWIVNRRTEIAKKQERQQEQRQFKTTLEVGSVLTCSWGYEQTNVEFWKVIEKKSDKTVVLRELAGRLADKSESSSMNMAGFVVPTEQFISGREPVKKRVLVGNMIELESFRTLQPWDGRPRYSSWYG